MAIAVALASIAACERPLMRRPLRLPPLERRAAVTRRPREPSVEDQYQAFVSGAFRLPGSPLCARAPVHAVWIERTADGEVTFFGFCDGVVASRDGVGVRHRNVLPPRARPASLGWRPLVFWLRGREVRAEAPTTVEVRGEGVDAARLIGKDFDLHLRPEPPSERALALLCVEPWALVDAGIDYVICRRGRRHRVLARTTLARMHYLAESEPRMRASRQQVEAMLRSVQLLHTQDD